MSNYVKVSDVLDISREYIERAAEEENIDQLSTEIEWDIRNKSIVLDDDAVCCSYQRKTIDSMSEEFSNEKTPEYADLETIINCNENSCYFNMNNLCKASEVTIDSDAWCATYRKR